MYHNYFEQQWKRGKVYWPQIEEFRIVDQKAGKGLIGLLDQHLGESKHPRSKYVHVFECLFSWGNVKSFHDNF